MHSSPVAQDNRRLSLWWNRNFLLLSFAVFTSNFGSVTLLMSLSLKAYSVTGSSLIAGAVYGSQWLLPLFFLPLVGWLANRYPLRSMMVVGQASSIVVTVLASYCYPAHLPAFFGLMAIRGVLENLAKSSASVALKIYIAPALLEKASSYYDTNRYVSSAAASLVGVLFLNVISTFQIAALCSVAFLIAGGCFLLLPQVDAVAPKAPRPTLAYWGETWKILKYKPQLRRDFWNLCFVTGIFQGFYYIARSALPLGQLGMSLNMAALVQVLISLTFALGAIVVARFMQTGSTLTQILTPFKQVIFGACFMASSVLGHDPLLGTCSFLLCLFFYELQYTTTNNRIILQCTREEISYVSAAKYGGLTFCMLDVIAAAGLTADKIGFRNMTYALSAVATIGYASLNLRRHKD
ncbi:MFS transporter [Robbsia andropogonis]|uniref:MFS transporter n=1 Tax=Robbsia andropogonis TaxID=28092 RepID=UPI0004B1713C|nr:MFS transporter [Robbsia andropogonis]